MSYHPRESANRLIEMVEEGLLSWEQIARSTLSYMSEADVHDMGVCNDLLIASDFDDDNYDDDE